MARQSCTVGIRLLPEIDIEMRNFVRRRGDVAKLIVAALESVKMESVSLLQLEFTAEPARGTVCVIPVKLYKQVKAIAFKRGVSANCLMNSAIRAYTKKLVKQKS